ncbi:ATP-binding protein [Thiomicrorhabdus sp. 6S3-12]|uniref:sensor histidine kinase n=1 Tax=Thiomicrorhabdus sp. 6S3-12 TaxID=2819681 RepID=UPI001AAD4D24|nr:ATP-binding protein [Thiomicrorhabdus sp. 6S3-12]MBO1924740.1 HAMP domain-containing protein [Thiomicrorhabdus sp. 6S3-12]
MGSLGRFIKQFGWVSLLFSVLMVMLAVMSQILQNASQFAEVYSVLLFITWLGVGVLLVLFFRTLWKLYKQLKQKIPGIKVTIRLTLLATLLMGIPAITIFAFSLNFIQQGISQWFDVTTEDALEKASSLASITLDNKTRDSLKLTQSVVSQQQIALEFNPIAAVDSIRNLINAQEVALYQTNQQLIAFSSQDNTQILPNTPGDNLFQQVRKETPYAAIESQPGATQKEQFVRVFIPITNSLNAQYALQAIFPLPTNITELSDSVALATEQYRELSYLKGPLTFSFTLILSMVVLLTLVTAVLFTIRAVQNFTSPIRVLARGTKAVSRGDYTIRMPVKQQDEFGDLINSFNDMIARIAQARNDIKLSHQQAEVQKLYLQAIIQNLSSGVITLDTQKQIRTLNSAAERILGIKSEHLLEQSLPFLAKAKNLETLQDDEAMHQQSLQLLFDKIVQHFDDHQNQPNLTWALQFEFQSSEGQKILMLHGSPLPSLEKQVAGYIIVIDDITDLVQAQLHAAWSDVARRLAHEIKNPLTPIQLSAERLNFKLGRRLQGEDRELLERLTQTIIEQVSTMQTLVQAFSDYANTPEVELQKTELCSLIQGITEMYQNPNAKWQVTSHLNNNCPLVMADKARLRQLFHNLIKNALEATEDLPQPRVEISAEQIDEDSLQIKVCDNGPGIPKEAQNWIFEPYATDKPKGTGLGLAIVRKIVDEHHGQIRVKASPAEGTCFIITLPVLASERT